MITFLETYSFCTPFASRFAFGSLRHAQGLLVPAAELRSASRSKISLRSILLAVWDDIRTSLNRDQEDILDEWKRKTASL